MRIDEYPRSLAEKLQFVTVVVAFVIAEKASARDKEVRRL
jgi:hypothetical protein